MDIRFFVASVERNAVLDIDTVILTVCRIFFIFTHQLNIIADFSLQAYVRHDSVAGFRVDTRHISSVRVAVGISVFHIE